jgi:lipopolysaccharide transport system ATP-binding protein
MRFTDVAFESMGGERQDQAATGQGLRVLLTYETNGRPLRNVDASISVRGALGELFFLCNVTVANGLLESIPPKGTLRCTIPKLPLTPALYNVGLWCQVGSTVADRIDNAAKLEVISGDFFGTGKLPAKKNRAVLVDHQWDLA